MLLYVEYFPASLFLTSCPSPVVFYYIVPEDALLPLLLPGWRHTWEYVLVFAAHSGGMNKSCLLSGSQPKLGLHAPTPSFANEGNLKTCNQEALLESDLVGNVATGLSAASLSQLSLIASLT